MAAKKTTKIRPWTTEDVRTLKTTGAATIVRRRSGQPSPWPSSDSDLSVSYDRVGDVLVAQGNLPEALKSFRDGLAIADRLAKADPGNAGWQREKL